MSIDFLPSLAITLSLAAVALLPLILLALSHGPWKIPAPGRRFIVSAGITSVCWVGFMFLPGSPDLVDVFAGGLLLATGFLAGFTLWTLVAWGFTLSMLLTLARHPCRLTEQEWVHGYTNGKPVEAFARDRLGVLFRLGLAEARTGRVVMTPGRGRRVARVAGVLRRVFGLPK